MNLRAWGARAGVIALLTILTAMISPGIADQSGPQRIVTLGGDITEIVYELGEGKRIVARDSTSTYPDEVKALPDVGYFRQLGAEGLLSLKPDLILASASSGPPETLDQIAAAGVQVVQLPEDLSPEGLLKKVDRIASLLKVEEAGTRLAVRLDEEIKQAKTAIAAMSGTPKTLYIINPGGGSLRAAGEGTAPDAIIKLARGVNVFAPHKGYKIVASEAVLSMAPEVIALPEHALSGSGGRQGLAKLPSLSLTPAAKRNRFAIHGASFLLSFGPRLPKAMVEFARAIRGDDTP